jgi:hypothetical protein
VSTPFHELEIVLTRRIPPVYAARLRYQSPDDDGDQLRDATIKLDPAALNRCLPDPPAYGRALAAALTAEPRLRDAWTRARTAAAGQPLRVRLGLDETATELHRVRWESLADPDSGQPLLTDQNVWFSRHLSSFDMRPFRLRTKGALRVLVAVASPSDLGNLRVGGRDFEAEDGFQTADELSMIGAALKGITATPTVLPSPAAGQPTLANLVRHLRDGYDIVFLLAHGVLDGEAPRLLLVRDDGSGAVVDGADLIREMEQLRHPPRLVVLSSCQSAGPVRPFREAGPEGGLDAALGPQFGRVGIPAVIAMLGNVYQQTARTFVGKFFEHLAADGQIDRAVGEARFAVKAEPDYWSPVLYTRLVRGQVWYDRSRGPAAKFPQWLGVIDQLKEGQCVPVIGSGLLERLVGSTRDIAGRLAGGQFTPLSPGAREDLPQVAQYLSTIQKGRNLRKLYLDDLAAEVVRRFPEVAAAGDAPPPAGGPADPLARPAGKVRRLLSAAAQRAAADGPPEAHAVLASLNCPLYITTNPDDLLTDALRRAGKRPVEQRCNWLVPPVAPTGSPPDGPTPPTPEAPLVYQLLGHLSDPWSVVLSEDDYFKFLVGMAGENAVRRPSFVNQVLTQSGLLFLGFHLDDWDFRAFLHFFLSREAARTRRQFGVLDVAVQLDPEDGRNAEPDRIRDYLEKLFGQAEITIYWGSSEEFLEELGAQWRPSPTPAAATST